MSSALQGNGSTSKWRKIRLRILQRDNYVCQMCGMDGNTVDHIVPRSLGGTDQPFNLQCLCNACNASKGGANRLQKGLKKAQKGLKNGLKTASGSTKNGLKTGFPQDDGRFFGTAGTPPTLHGLFIPQNDSISHD